MQKALTQMNLQLHHLVSDITGKTGMRIIRAILDGTRDPHVLASYRDGRCKASVETIAQALEGNYRPEHLFAIEQAVALYDPHHERVVVCDRRIEAALAQLAPPEPPAEPLPASRHKTRQPNALAFEVRQALHAVIGVDLTQIHGIGPYLANKLVGECGTDVSAWPTAKHFTSWLCLSPGNKISGGKVFTARAPAAPTIALVPCCAWRPSTSARPTARSAPFIVAWRCVWARQRPSPPPHASSRCFSTTSFAIEWTTAIRERPTTEERHRQRVVQNLERRASTESDELRTTYRHRASLWTCYVDPVELHTNRGSAHRCQPQNAIADPPRNPSGATLK